MFQAGTCVPDHETELGINNTCVNCSTVALKLQKHLVLLENGTTHSRQPMLHDNTGRSAQHCLRTHLSMGIEAWWHLADGLAHTLQGGERQTCGLLARITLRGACNRLR